MAVGVGVEIARTIEPSYHRLAVEILHRQPKRIKFDRNLVINCETANINQVFDKSRGHKYFTKKKR